jgi:cell wall-associated NlpC family hydrolase
VIEYENLVGRQFAWGSTDCIGLLRDFFAQNFAITIRDYARPTNWDADELDLIRTIYPLEGFDLVPRWRVKDLHPGDVLAMSLRSGNPNHFAVFVGENKIVHHRYLRMSEVEILREAYIQSTSFVLRHPQVPDMRDKYPDVTLEELLSARNKVKAD